MLLKNLIRKLGLNLNQVKDGRFTKVIEKGNSIPRIIHQTHYTKELSSEINLNIKNLKAANPEWEFRFYDDNDIQIYIKNYFPEMLNFYNKINLKYGAARADFFRYLVVYKEGGVYLDVKSSLSIPLDEMLNHNDEYILAHWDFSHNPYCRHLNVNNPNGEYQQWHIISTKGHPFLKAVIENVCKNLNVYNVFLHDVGMTGVLNLTGPIAYSLAILPILHLHKHRVGFDKDFGLIYSVYSNSLGGHRPLFKTHYASLKESIVNQSTVGNLLFPFSVKLKEITKRSLFK